MGTVGEEEEKREREQEKEEEEEEEEKKEEDEDGGIAQRGFHGRRKHPRKRFYRARAHSNPLSDSQFPVPVCPSLMDWSQHFPAFFPGPAAEGRIGGKTSNDRAIGSKTDDGSICRKMGDGAIGRKMGGDAAIGGRMDGEEGEEEEEEETIGLNCVRFCDVGCGFGGLLVTLSPLFPDMLMVGMELRDKVSEYVRERIVALRSLGTHENVSVLRTNAMKYLPNYFRKGQLHKMFFLFPDPHFKEKNHRRRVISPTLLSEYAFVTAPGGLIYTITDVRELGDWMRSCLHSHPLFEEVPAEEQSQDQVVALLRTATEEGKKVQRNGGETFQSVYRRIANPRDGC